MKNLGDRKHNILCLAIEEYIKDASPITSGGVQKSLGDLSTATLRNELNALEAMGFLKQLHTSSGRVPTQDGYKYYVSEILKDVNANKTELENVKESIKKRTSSLTDIVTQIGDALNLSTSYPTAVLLHGYQDLVLTDFKFIPLLTDELMVLIGTNAGYINTSIMAEGVSLESSEDASRYMTKVFQGKTIKFLLEHFEEFETLMEKDIEGFKRIVDGLIEGLKALTEKGMLHIKRSGATKFFGKEREDARKVMEILDDSTAVEDVLLKDLSEGISVSFEEESSGSFAVVKAPIRMGDIILGEIGVFGPSRMDYGKITSALSVVISELNKGDDKN